jgi:hypothetical protein
MLRVSDGVTPMDVLQWLALYLLIIAAIISGCLLVLGFDWAWAKVRPHDSTDIPE